MSTMLLFTTVPVSRMMPNMAGMERYLPATSSAAATPTNCSGIATMMVMGCLKERNWATNTK